LRQAIIDANSNPGFDTITFEPGVTGTIVLSEALPAIVDSLTIAGPGANMLSISGENAYPVFLITHGTNVTITEVTVRDGNAVQGGGVWSAGNLHLDSVHVISNSATYGGGIYVYDGRATLAETLVISNSADSRGGGVYISHISATLSVNGGGIKNNSAGYSGGGVAVGQGDASLNQTQLAGNSAQAAGGGAFIDQGGITLSGTQVFSNSAQAGGGLFIEGTGASAVLTGTQVFNNLATGYLWGGGGLYVERGELMLTGVRVYSNWTTNGDGGGVCIIDGQLLIRRTQLVDNSAIHGGGIFLGGNAVWGSVSARIENTIIAQNQATGDGGGLAVGNNSTVTMRHNTIAGNLGGSGVQVGLHSQVVLTNTILTGHTVGISVTAGSTATLENTLWGSGAWVNDIDWGGEGTVVTGTVNLWADPAFVAPEAGDYHLSAGSAAIDQAVDIGMDIDIDEDPRPIGMAPDLGADEAWLLIYLPVLVRNG